MARSSKKSGSSRKPAVVVEVEAAAVPAPEAAVETAPAPAEEPKVKTPKWEPLPADRTEWIRQNARPAVAPCLCGCGETTKGRFFPGHDATLKATLTAHGDAETLALFGWA